MNHWNHAGHNFSIFFKKSPAQLFDNYFPFMNAHLFIFRYIASAKVCLNQEASKAIVSKPTLASLLDSKQGFICANTSCDRPGEPGGNREERYSVCLEMNDRSDQQPKSGSRTFELAKVKLPETTAEKEAEEDRKTAASLGSISSQTGFDEAASHKNWVFALHQSLELERILNNTYIGHHHTCRIVNLLANLLLEESTIEIEESDHEQDSDEDKEMVGNSDDDERDLQALKHAMGGGGKKSKGLGAGSALGVLGKDDKLVSQYRHQVDSLKQALYYTELPFQETKA
ncbi:MAG: hypothetical protein J3R72DRAFT_516476 [Linnemannia gamsii]|nr:MAG: hypothetical protein J3R72DRAFT_516476 [Linnemannia gamsii]